MAKPLRATAADARDALLRELVGPDGRPALPERLREPLARLALDALTAFVVLLAPDGTVLDANARALVAGALAPEALVGRPWRDARWWSPDGAACFEAALRSAGAGDPARCEAALLAGAGAADPVLLELSLRPVADSAGTVALVLVEGRDVTAARRADAGRAAEVERLDAELSHRRREAETALDAMRFAREQADRASAQKASLLRMVSHELRTPLAALLLQADRLRRDAAELSPYHRDAVGRMRSALNRLSGLVASLLEFSRVQAGRVTLAPERVDPAALAAAVVDELRPAAAGKPIALSGPEAGSVPPMETDARLLRVVLLNLVENAIKFTEAGSVSVEVAIDGDEHRFTVSDTGRGIHAEDQARIFEPFEQLETIARKHTPGIGLGLALVRDMVGALGGRIAVRSHPGVGSIFEVALPSRLAAPARTPAPLEAR